MRRFVTAAGAGAIALALAACTSPSSAETVGEQLPDLTALGLTSFECGTGDAIGADFVEPEGDYVAQCWQGAPAGRFDDLATRIQVEVIQATGGEDVSAQVCPEDLLTGAEGLACRAAYVPEDVVVRTVVILSDLSSVVSALPEDPTDEDIAAALDGAAVEVLVATQPSSDEG